MKKTLQSLLITSALAASMSAFAVDGTVNFTGEVTAQTCRFDGATGAATKNVTLPKVSTSALSTVGQVAGRTKITFALSQCSEDTGVSVRFEPGPTVSAATGNLLNQTSGGSNAQIQLLNSDFGIINASTNTGHITTNIAQGNATLTYYAQYVAATAAATAGIVSSSVQYSLAYN